MKVRNLFIIIFFGISVILIGKHIIHKEETVNVSTVQLKQPKPIGTVIIDPGHGGYDEGASSKKGNREKDIVLEISLKLGKKLKNKNFKVFFTRESDKALGKTIKDDILNRAEFIDSKKGDIFLSIHLNGSDSRSAKGIESYYEFLNNRSYKLAESIQDELSSIEYTKDRGLKGTNEKNLGILRYSQTVGVLLELGFITNSEDEKYLVSNNGQDTIVDAIVSGILNYFE